MEQSTLVEHRRPVDDLVRGVVGRDAERAIARLAEADQWELMGEILLTAAEASARQIAATLLERERWDELALAACLRRQPPRRSTARSRSAVGRHAFRDFEQEAATAAVPEHIRAEADDMAQLAEQSRSTADRRDEAIDRDPVRDVIVSELGRLAVSKPGAIQALLTIARASAWEATRRAAALKIANNPAVLQRLVANYAMDELEDVREASRLTAVGHNIAMALGEQWTKERDKPHRGALEFIVEHHPDAEWQKSAQEALDYLAQQSSPES
jgi:hypothetical protein